MLGHQCTFLPSAAAAAAVKNFHNIWPHYNVTMLGGYFVLWGECTFLPAAAVDAAVKNSAQEKSLSSAQVLAQASAAQLESLEDDCSYKMKTLWFF